MFSTEDESKETSTCIDTFQEIDFKQGPTKGLRNVNEKVFNFFLNLHKLVQENLTAIDFIVKNYIHGLEESFFYSYGNFHGVDKFIGLCDADKLLYMLQLVCSFSEGLHFFKESIPKKKKQALRRKVQALSERQSGKATAWPSTVYNKCIFAERRENFILQSACTSVPSHI